MSTTVNRTAGVAGTFSVTFSAAPVAAPTLTIYFNAARTVVAVAAAPLVATANPVVWTAAYPATLAAGTYYLAFSAVYTVGQPAVVDSDDTLVLTSASASVGSAYATVADARVFGIGGGEVDDTTLAMWLEVASRMVDNHTQTTFGAGPATRTFYGVRSRVALPWPVSAVSVVTVDGTAALPTNDYVLEGAGGIRLIAPRYGATVAVTAVFGYPDVPSPVRMATLWLARELIRRGEERPAVATDVEGNATGLPTGVFVPRLASNGPGSTGNITADRLLAPYRQEVAAYSVAVG